MAHVLLAGVTGSLGAQVARLLHTRGHEVRGLTRDAARIPADLALSSKHIGNPLVPDTLAGAMDGMDCVFSCLGASVSSEPGAGRSPFTSVDTPANLALLEEAQRAGIKKFVYVSAFHNEAMKELAYIRAHEDVVHAVVRSGLEHSIVRPTGFFSALCELLPLARKGRLPSFKGGKAKSNPIHEGDLAQVCVEAILGKLDEHAAGGPDVLSRAEMNTLACQAVGCADRSVPAPLFALKAAALVTTPFHPRLAQLLEFLAALSENDLVAPIRGSRHLKDYFAERAARSSSRT